VQFNWIFVLVAGFVIFLFIISIIFSQKHAADRQSSISAMNQITTILKSKQQTSDVYSETIIPSTTMTFTCDEDTGIFNYKISDSERTDLPTAILFAPAELSTNKLLIWSQAFNTGFPVSVFTYLTTSDSVIIIYYNSQDTSTNPDPQIQGYASTIFDDLPSNITKTMSTKLHDYDGYKHEKIVCIEGDCPSQNGASGGKDYMMITPGDNGLYNYGNVTFYKNGHIDEKLPYFTKAGLYGAIFSYSPQYYNCQMSRALKQFEFKRSLVEKRLNLLYTDIDNNDCKTTIRVALDRAVIPMSNATLNSDNVTFMDDTMKNLDSWNTDLTLSSCPKIY